MSNDLIKVNSRVRVTCSVVPNATSFIGWTGQVVKVNERSVMVILDNDLSQQPIMFFKRELSLDQQ